MSVKNPTKKKLTEKELTRLLKTLPQWVYKSEKQLSRTYHFKTQIDALVAVARATVYVETKKYYPKIILSEKTVEIVCKPSNGSAISHTEIEFAQLLESRFSSG